MWAGESSWTDESLRNHRRDQTVWTWAGVGFDGIALKIETRLTFFMATNAITVFAGLWSKNEAVRAIRGHMLVVGAALMAGVPEITMAQFGVDLSKETP